MRIIFETIQKYLGLFKIRTILNCSNWIIIRTTIRFRIFPNSKNPKAHLLRVDSSHLVVPRLDYHVRLKLLPMDVVDNLICISEQRPTSIL